MAVTSLILISPDVGVTNPKIDFMRVVLPDPFGPITAVTDPLGKSSVTSFKTRNAPKVLLRIVTRSLFRGLHAWMRIDEGLRRKSRDNLFGEV